MSRRVARIDYRVLHNSGDKVAKSDSYLSDSDPSDEFEIESLEDTHTNDQRNIETSEDILALSSLFETTTLEDSYIAGSKMMTEQDLEPIIKEVVVSQEAIAADIDDFIEETFFDDTDSSELDAVIRKIENFRTSYREKHFELKRSAGDLYDGMFGEQYDLRLNKIKEFILSAKDIKRKLKHVEIKIRDDMKSSKLRSCTFLIQEINKSMEILNTYLTLFSDNI